MKNKKITHKITQGMYALTTKDGGCIVDCVARISADENPLIAVAVNKNNNTNKLMKENEKFALSVLGMDVSPKIIETFGMKSGRDIDKLSEFNTNDVEGVPVIDDSLGYMICEKVDSIDNNTHTLFIGRLIEADLIKNEEPMSYAYYQEHKDELTKVETENGKTAWICTVCGYIYYGEELPEDFKCPMCGVDKTLFKRK